MSGEQPETDLTVVVRRTQRPAALSQPDDFGHYLVVVEGDEAGRRIPLDRLAFTVGRDAARDIVLADPDVSRLHVRLSFEGDAVIVEDQSSTNGTFVDGRRIVDRTVLAEGGLLQIGRQRFTLERRSKRDVQRSEVIKRDLDSASQYVRSLLPPPIVDGSIRTDWLFQPSAQLGGDAFGYAHLDDDTFAIYLIDVSGHGASAAMHSVSVMNVLRQQALPRADMREPASVLLALNAMFDMERHDEMYFTMWYGVYHRQARTLRYACAGHHPGYLVAGDTRTLVPLRTAGVMIGAIPSAHYHAEEVVVPAGGCLYLFSDGVFEIVTLDHRPWGLENVLQLIRDSPRPDLSESQRVYQAVKGHARPGPLDDDFSVLVVTFM